MMKTSVLLVEDDAKLRRTLGTWISHAGYDVTPAPDGETAVRLLVAASFDVIVSDIVMGGLDGLGVLQAAGRLRPPPAVILLTGQGTLESAMAALRAGAFDYLLKPCNGSELLARIAAAAAHVDAQRQLRAALELLTFSAVGAGSLPVTSSGVYGAVHTSGYSTGPGARSGAGPGLMPGAIAPLVLPAPAPLPRAAAQGAPAEPDQVIVFGDLEVGPSRLQVSFEGRPVALTRIEYALLRHLVERQGQVCRYGELAFASHKLALDDGEARDLLRTHLQNLRSKLCRSYFRIDPGTGCMLAAPAAAGMCVAVKVYRP
jgi:DNA-binding response OmpR family regulator